MGDIGSDYKLLYKALKKAKDGLDKEACLEAVKRLHNNVVEAADGVPQMMVKMEAGEKKDQMQKDYTADMKILADAIVVLQKHIEADDLEAAMADIKAMKKLKGEGHEKYQEE